MRLRLNGCNHINLSPVRLKTDRLFIVMKIITIKVIRSNADTLEVEMPYGRTIQELLDKINETVRPSIDQIYNVHDKPMYLKLPLRGDAEFHTIEN
jgi:hypothetical protein